MKRRIAGLLSVLAVVLGLAVAVAPGGAGASTSPTISPDGSVGGWNPWWGHRSHADLSLVHGIPGLAVDIYVVKGNFSYKKLTDVQFGTAADLGQAFPGWVTPGYYLVDVVATGANPFHPLLLARFYLGWGQSKTVAAYVTASPAGVAGHPTLAVFTNNVRSTGGDARVTVRHLAVAPTVGVYADGSVPIVPAFSNGQTAAAVVPAGSYTVTVTAPNTPATVLDDLGNVALAANTNALAFAIGTYPATFKVVTLVIPTRP
jgi:hypothetical protein